METKKNVLVIEDVPLNREMLVLILKDFYNVFEAGNGQEALDFLHSTNETISIILLDLNMPIMDGYTFLKFIKNDSNLSLIPVIITTESTKVDTEIEALNLGAVDLVVKPYNPVIILKHVENLIGLSESTAVLKKYQYDKLTGLYTKEYFYDKLKEIIPNNQAIEYTLISTNIENFKLYNDAFGREEGDKLLIELAEFYKQTYGKNSYICRYSADRFLILTTRDFLNILKQTDNYNTPLKESVTVKYGIYNITDKTVEVEQMCDRAILVCDTIKGQYNKFYAIYDDTLRYTLLRNKQITDTMEDAIAKRQFILYLQPKVDIHTNKIIGAEALVRWNHPDLGFLTPKDFIPLFEENGFIFKLNMYVWEEVCNIISYWKKNNMPLLPISVNVSRTDCLRCNLGELFSELVKKYDFDSKYFHIEITESTYANNPGHIIKSIEEIKEKGFDIEMDDFGSGYSSLNMLSQINIDIIKLDMSFIRSETSKDESDSILIDVINMSHRKKLKIVAEGVETKYQLERLKKYGCEYAQGYYFSKPIPVEEFNSLINKSLYIEN